LNHLYKDEQKRATPSPDGNQLVDPMGKILAFNAGEKNNFLILLGHLLSKELKKLWKRNLNLFKML
jgi:hypothetical protein